VPFLPALKVPTQRDGYIIDQAAGRIVLLITPKNTPLRTVVVYGFKKGHYGIFYETKYYFEGNIAGYLGFYDRYMIVKEYQGGCLFYDMKNGGKFRKLVQPKTDKCSLGKPTARFDIKFGMQGKALIYCKVENAIHATVYNIMEHKQSKNFHFSLEGGVDVPLKSVSISSVGNDIYCLDVVNGAPFAVGYLESNNYQPVQTRIVGKIGRGISQYSIKYNNIAFTMIVSSPGPSILGFRQAYHTLDGLVKKGSGKTTLEQISLVIPDIKETDAKFYLNPAEIHVSLIVLIDSPRKTKNNRIYFDSALIYTCTMQY
jgi:hypothetical protein